MADIIMTLKARNDFEVELKLSGDYIVEDAINVFYSLYKLDSLVGSRLQAEPLGIVLVNGKTFAEQGVTHGAVLTFM